jgi:hypothetical protein
MWLRYHDLMAIFIENALKNRLKINKAGRESIILKIETNNNNNC